MELFLSKKYVVFNVLGSLFSGMLFLLYVMGNLPEPWLRFVDMTGDVLAGGKDVFVAGLGTLVGAWALFSLVKLFIFLMKLNVRIDESGIRDRVSLFRVRNISWENIRDIFVLSYPTHSTVVIKSSKPVPFSQRIRGLEINETQKRWLSDVIPVK